MCSSGTASSWTVAGTRHFRGMWRSAAGVSRPSAACRGTARRVIEAKGLTVAPGFIDIHNHSDYTVLADGNAESMVRQGVTTMILGEGGSAAPLGGKQQPAGEGATWTDFNGYFDRLRKQGISTNIGTLRGLEPDLDVRARRESRSAHGRRTRADARAGPPGHGAGRAGRGEFAERPAGRVDRYRHAGGHVRGGGAARRHLLDAHAHRGQRRLRGGGGGDRDRPPRADCRWTSSI